MKVSYCCTRNVASIIESHNKKLINASIKSTLPCNRRKKRKCLLYGKCRAENIVYKCTPSVDEYPSKVYLVTTQEDFKQRFYNHQMSFNNEDHFKDTTLSKYVWEIKRKLKIMSSLKSSIIKSAPAYSNISEKFLIISTRMNCLIKDRSLFQSTATLTSFYCLIINLTIRPSGKCSIRNI